MKRTLDVEKVQAALKRAAFKAAHGTRAERAGRFLATRAPRSARPSGESRLPDSRRRKA
jgi:hypothetical protein